MIEVAPGVHWLRMPLPVVLKHINLWLLEDGDRWVVVDSGFNTEETRTLWEEIFSGPAAKLSAGRHLCTHYHPDHFGLTAWLEERFGFKIVMTQGEWLLATLLYRSGTDDYRQGQNRFLREHGLPEEIRARFRSRGNSYRRPIWGVPIRFERIRHGDKLAIGGRTWEVIMGEGHAVEHACLYCPELGVLISGDQVLPQITPNISIHWYRPGVDPLTDYLRSFQQFRHLPDDTLVLPSHRLPFRGLQRRIDGLIAHHDARLDETREALSHAPQTAFSLIPYLFRRELDDHGLHFAIGEALAHLVYLVTLGEAREWWDDEGISHFSAVS